MEKNQKQKISRHCPFQPWGVGGQPVFAASGCLFKRHCGKFLLTVMYEVTIMKWRWKRIQSHLLRSTDGMRHGMSFVTQFFVVFFVVFARLTAVLRKRLHSIPRVLVYRFDMECGSSGTFFLQKFAQKNKILSRWTGATTCPPSWEFTPSMYSSLAIPFPTALLG
jgi:hypothetical protein